METQDKVVRDIIAVVVMYNMAYFSLYGNVTRKCWVSFANEFVGCYL